jgi:hypothetical protein
MKYRTIRVSKPLMTARMLLNEYEEVMMTFREYNTGVRISNDLINRIVDTKILSETLINNICAIDGNLIKLESHYEGILQDKVTKYFDKLQELFKAVIDPANMTLYNDHRESLNKIKDTEQEFTELKAKVSELLKYLAINPGMESSCK